MTAEVVPQFPDPRSANADGLLAVGGELTTPWLLAAYAQGVFPWFDDDADPVLWWSPDPRAVAQPGVVRLTRSLAKRLRNGGFDVTFDQSFERVIGHCAGVRRGNTWITPRMQQAYVQLHDLGFAHSVEVRKEGNLVGGLYGLSLGRMFFGESMFSLVSDASKVAFLALHAHLYRNNFDLIDCQLENEHLFTLGVASMPREEFLVRVEANSRYPTMTGQWTLAEDWQSLVLGWREQVGP